MQLFFVKLRVRIDMFSIRLKIRAIYAHECVSYQTLGKTCRPCWPMSMLPRIKSRTESGFISRHVCTIWHSFRCLYVRRSYTATYEIYRRSKPKLRTHSTAFPSRLFKYECTVNTHLTSRRVAVFLARSIRARWCNTAVGPDERDRHDTLYHFSMSARLSEASFRAHVVLDKRASPRHGLLCLPASHLSSFCERFCERFHCPWV